jgi:hypothetical protein
MRFGEAVQIDPVIRGGLLDLVPGEPDPPMASTPIRPRIANTTNRIFDPDPLLAAGGKG